METQTKALRTFSMIIALTLIIIAFFTFSFRDALVILFVLNMIIGISSAISGLMPVLGQIGYLLFITKAVVPVFFNRWFPEIPHNWYVDMLVVLGLLNSINASVQWVRIRQKIREYKSLMNRYDNMRETADPYYRTHHWSGYLN
jgi:membrane-bound ClpP family serine protease